MASFATQHENGSYGLEQAAEIALAKASWEQSQAKLANKGIVHNLNQSTKGYSSHPDTKPAATSTIGVAVTVPTLVVSSAPPLAAATPATQHAVTEFTGFESHDGKSVCENHIVLSCGIFY